MLGQTRLLAFLSQVPFRHPEKKAKGRIFWATSDAMKTNVYDAVEMIRKKIKYDVRDYVSLARVLIEGQNGR